MTRQIKELVRAMGRDDWDEGLLNGVCQAAELRLKLRLKPGLAPKDCGGAFPIAAAWLALGALEDSGGLEGVQSFTAGDLTVRAGTAGRAGALEEQAEKLMAPFCTPSGFAVRGTPG